MKNHKFKINKKVLLYIIIGIVVLLFICFLIFRNRKMTCTLESNQEQNGYVLNTTYTAIYNRGIVKKVIIHETITSEDDTVLDKFETDWKEQYDYNSKAFGGYQYQINKKNQKVTSDIEIDYKVFNLQKFIRFNNAMKEYVNDKNQVTIQGIKTMYEKSGAICK